MSIWGSCEIRYFLGQQKGELQVANSDLHVYVDFRIHTLLLDSPLLNTRDTCITNHILCKKVVHYKYGMLILYTYTSIS